MAIFNDTIPAGSEAVKLGAQRIREMKTTLNSALSQIFSDSLVFIPKFVTATLLANDASVDANRAVGSDHIKTSAVTLAKLVDGILTADAAGRLKMADAFVTLAKLATNIFDGSTLKDTPVDGDKFVLADSAASGATKHSRLSDLKTVLAASLPASTSARFTSSDLALTAGTQLLSTAHGLTSPTRIRGVLVCQAAGTGQAGWSAGDVVDLDTVSDTGSARPVFALGISGSNAIATMNSLADDTISVIHKTSGVPTSVGVANYISWKLRVIVEV